MRQLAVALACVAVSSASTPRPIFLVDGHLSSLGWRGRLVAIQRTEARTPRAALLALVRGPTAAERGHGIRSALPAGTRLVAISVSRGTARVSFRGGSSRAWQTGGVYATAQVVYTLTARPRIKRVWMRVGGRRCCVFDHSGRPYAHALTRAVFAAWQGEPR
ncbi:MAG TPA: GerMN domain-containing protein [Gaiellaceae bacterium]|nr:GerMN domain-containing protein [Gaiellaceae bacterium]